MMTSPFRGEDERLHEGMIPVPDEIIDDLRLSEQETKRYAEKHQWSKIAGLICMAQPRFDDEDLTDKIREFGDPALLFGMATETRTAYRRMVYAASFGLLSDEEKAKVLAVVKRDARPVQEGQRRVFAEPSYAQRVFKWLSTFHE